MTGVTSGNSNANRIKAGDNGSLIKLTLKNIEGATISNIEYVRLTKDFTSYIEVTDIQVAENTVLIRLPDVPLDEYFVEIKDGAGRIYPAEGTLKFEVVRSLEGGKQTVFVDYKDEIIGELPALIGAHLDANPDAYKGPQGEPGVAAPPKVYTRDEYDALGTYDDNTVYIVKEV